MHFKALNVDTEQGIFEGYASPFGNVDSDGEIVDSGAFKESIASGFAKEGVKILAQHRDRDMPLGKSLELREDSDGLYVKGYISPTSMGNDYRQLIKDGVLGDMSIGYDIKSSYLDDKGVRHLTELELIEISIVTFPANPDAKIQGYKQKGGTKQMEDEMTGLSVVDLQEAIASAVKDGVEEAVKAMKAAEEDAEGENEKNEDDSMEEEKNDGEDNENKSDDKPEDQKKKKSFKGKARTKARDDVQRKWANIYIQQSAQESGQKSKLPPGIGWARYQKCMGLAKGDPDRAANIARKMYDDPMLHREIKALSATVPSEGGYLVPEMYASEVIPMLYAKAVVMRLGATVVPMPGGNLNMPRMGSGATAYYTGELRKGKSSEVEIENVKLSAKKLTMFVPISNDLLRSNSYAADQLILNDAVKQMALRMDKAALMGKGTNFVPKGLLGMSGIPKVNINGKPDEKTTGLMLAELINNDADVENEKLGWALPGAAWGAFYNTVNAMGLYTYRDQMDKRQLNGYAFAVSTQLPTDGTTNRKVSVVLGDWSEFLIGEQMQMESEMFREGSFIDDDGNTISALSNDTTILRIISTHDFAVRHEKSFVIGENVHTA